MRNIINNTVDTIQKYIEDESEIDFENEINEFLDYIEDYLKNINTWSNDYFKILEQKVNFF